MSTSTFKLSELPFKMYEEMTKDLLCYLVGLLSVKNTKNGEEVKLIGSGTFITIDGVSGILTAQHVTDALSVADLGLIIAEQEHRPILNSDLYQVIKLRNDNKNSLPDLAFIHLPESTLGTIKAKKSFYNIGTKVESSLQNPLEKDFGVWFICGFPDELKSEGEKSVRGYDSATGFYGLCGATGGVSDEYIENEFDYIEVPVECGTADKIPSNYGGVSGGSLWQAPLYINENEKRFWGDPVLSGVAFYQSIMENNRRTIKCHARQSIYKKIPQILDAKGLLTKVST
ncbi:hypothetical protein KA005_25780 [bacterium]|nr:hypothetical protein [bacterium]